MAKKTLQDIRRKSAMAVPSLFTIGNLGCGFFSILSSINGNFHRAGWLIFIAMFLDGIDGRVARLLKAESEFGVEMDSLADLISFCAAPAFLMYFMALNSYMMGSAVAFCYVLCGALRLAKFNTMALDGTGSKKYFSGLPTPAAAGILSAFAVSYSIFAEAGAGQNVKILNSALPYIYSAMVFIVLGLAVLMVSNIPYATFKSNDRKIKFGAAFILFIAIFVYMMIRYPQNVVFVVLSSYVLVGIFAFIIRAFKNIK